MLTNEPYCKVLPIFYICSGIYFIIHYKRSAFCYSHLFKEVSYAHLLK